MRPPAEGAALALYSCVQRHVPAKPVYGWRMTTPDLNLLLALDVLLAEGSVAGAARHLRLSPSAMSRTLARLRQTTGDALLVRAGRGLVPTPRAIALHERIGPLLQEAQALLRPVAHMDLQTMERLFTLRNSEGFVETFGAALIARVGQQAPGVRLRFVQKPDKDSTPLRQGSVDLETGVVEQGTAPELRVQALFRDRILGVVRAGHPLSQGEVTPQRYAQGGHICVSRQGLDREPVDDGLAALGLERRVVTIVAGFATALALARSSGLIAAVPERHTAGLRSGMHSFALPVATPEFTVSMLWHPRLDGDPAHRWLRSCVREVCGEIA